MSEQNLEIVRAIYEALNGPKGGLGALDFVDDHAEFVNPDHAIEPGTRQGHQGFIDALAAVDVAFDDHAQEVERLIDAGPDKVLALTTFRARGRDSGVELKVPEQHVWTLNEGKVVRLEWFHDKRQALEAAGVGE